MKKLISKHFHKAKDLIEIKGVGKPMKIYNASYHQQKIHFTTNDIINFRTVSKLSQRSTDLVFSFLNLTLKIIGSK